MHLNFSILASINLDLLLQLFKQQLNNNNHDNINVYSAVIIARPLQEFTRFIRWMQPQAAANPQTKPTDLGCESPLEADTHFIIPQWAEGWVDLGGWLYTETVYLPTDGQSPIQVLTGPDVEQLCWSRPTRYHKDLSVPAVTCSRHSGLLNYRPTLLQQFPQFCCWVNMVRLTLPTVWDCLINCRKHETAVYYGPLLIS